MTNYAYIVAPDALQDLELIRVFYSGRGEQSVRRVLRDLRDKITLLTEFPHLGASRDDLSAGLRAFPCQRHVIFYRIRKEKVEIARVLRETMDPTSETF